MPTGSRAQPVWPTARPAHHTPRSSRGRARQADGDGCCAPPDAPSGGSRQPRRPGGPGGAPHTSAPPHAGRRGGLGSRAPARPRPLALPPRVAAARACAPGRRPGGVLERQSQLAGDRPLPQTRWLGMHATTIAPRPDSELSGHQAPTEVCSCADERLLAPRSRAAIPKPWALTPAGDQSSMGSHGAERVGREGPTPCGLHVGSRRRTGADAALAAPGRDR